MKNYERQEYKLLTSNSGPGLSGQVNLLLSEGWQLYGYPKVEAGNPEIFAQAVVRSIELPSR